MVLLNCENWGKVFMKLLAVKIGLIDGCGF